ncbi:MAG: OmpA family protein, partial [Planctomycetota bacterium]
MEKGWKIIAILTVSGILGTGCVSARAYKNLENQYHNEISGLKEHRTDLERALKEYKILSANVEKVKADNARLAAENRRLTATMSQMEDSLKKDLGDMIRGVEGGKLTPTGVEFQGEVLFSSGSASLKEKAKEILTNLAGIIKNHPDYIIRIDGHTDTDPINKSKGAWKTGENIELGSHRAINVWMHLKSQSVDPAKMFISSFGEYWPKDTNVDNNTPENKRENRRVEVMFLKTGSLGSEEESKSDAGEEKEDLEKGKI